ncbi:D-Ala-D-Ala carboxypeptidase family metallohydrolase [Moraxella nonliquefaciens]|uniref:D-Ala-D-Ala carboxypeptidase family metallohydrolase n=1 Tax=Moraxella nonliquefaciens TaxID=478 RepID=UPI001EF54D95|nr:D-Ala-D-Ala carboxypeptidase family metallohydrolase [Moraxella nonliquefaciens]MCG7411081.1 D-Ala-D-Ala carboxypeptidase family metallohydrolase [Moraxella nonliquefaciens]
MSSYIKQIQTAIGTTPDGIWGNQSIHALRVALSKGVVIPITKNMTLNELLASTKAREYNIDNMPSQSVLEHLIDSAINLWQPARDILGYPITITSGYRCDKLNTKVNGSKNSAHLYGYAIDFVCPAFGNTRAVVKHLADEFKKRGIKFDQCILEYPQSPNSWVHLGYKRSNGGQRGQVFRIG